MVVGGRLLEDLDDRPARGALLAQQLAGAGDVVRAEHHVDVRCPLDDDRSRSFWARQPPTTICMSGRSVLEGLQLAEVAVELVVGVLADAAGVEHDDVGVVDVGGRAQAVGLEEAGDALGVVLVHLAPVGAHDVGAVGHGAVQATAGPTAQRPQPSQPAGDG